MRARINFIVGVIVVGLVVALCAGVIASAVGCAPVDAQYSDADRKTHDHIAPITADLIDGKRTPADFDDDEKQAVHDTLDTWGERVNAAADEPK